MTTAAIDEAALLKQIAMGGHDAREALKPLYHYYAPRFRAFYLRRGLAHADADELCQEAFIKIARSTGAAGIIRSPRAWLWRVARSVMLDFLKRSNVEQSVDDWSELVEPEDQQARFDEQLGLKRCVEKQFAEFSRRHTEGSQVVSWAVVEGFTAVEIAELIGRSHGATREFLSQMKKHLRALLRVCDDYLR